MDFRTKFYNYYVTKFKKGQLAVTQDRLESYRRWAEFKYLPLLSGMDHDSYVLEIGCGPGYLLEFLSNKGFRNVQGVDISEEQIQIARQRGCNAQVADVFSFLKTRAQQFDVVTGIDFLEHFTKDELMSLLPLIYNSMKNGARAIFQVPNGEGLFAGQVIWGDITHLTIFTSESLSQILNLQGFTDIEFKETGPIPRGFTGCIRAILWGCIRKIAYLIKRIATGKTQQIWTENLICCCRK